jgi:hypothetical protein
VLADAEALAVHYFGAGEHERACEFAATAAARAAEALAFDRAARLYRFALDLRPPEREVARSLQIALGDTLANAGRGAEAAAIYIEASDGASAAEALDLERRAAEELLRSGHIAEGIAALTRVLSAVGLRLAPSPQHALASLVWRRARIRLRGLAFRERDASQVPADQLKRVDIAYAVTSGLGMVDNVRAADFQAQQLLLALDVGEPLRILRALAAESIFLSLPGLRLERRCAAALTRVQELAQRLEVPEAQAIAIGAAGIIAFQQGRFAESINHTAEAEQLFRNRCTGYRWELVTAQLFQLYGQVLIGQLKRTLERLPTLLKEADERGDRYSYTNIQVGIGHFPGLLADDVPRARHDLAEAIARWNVPGAMHLQHFNSAMSESQIDFHQGQGERVWERLESCWERFRRSQLFRVQTILVGALSNRCRAGLACALAGRRERLAATERDASRLEREKVPYAVALAKQMRAGVALLRGDQETALRLLAESERRLFAVDMRWQANASRWIHGKLLGGDEGARLLGEAERYFLEEGMVNVERMVAMQLPLMR